MPLGVRVVTGTAGPLSLPAAWSGAAVTVLVDAAITSPPTPGRMHRCPLHEAASPPRREFMRPRRPAHWRSVSTGGVPPTLARTLRSTNCIESMISVCREHAGNVKRWRDGQVALRWCAAGMVEAGKQFRRVNGHVHLPTLRAALERESAEPVGTMGHDDQVSAA